MFYVKTENNFEISTMVATILKFDVISVVPDDLMGDASTRNTSFTTGDAVVAAGNFHWYVRIILARGMFESTVVRSASI